LYTVKKAFVLGAGLGTRLKKLTEKLPKPMIPVFGKPLIEFAFDHLIDAGFEEFIINTHHEAKAYKEYFKTEKYRDKPLTFVHEPILLDTGGGIDNVSNILKPNPFIVYNGDILTDLPLNDLIDAHNANNYLVTLALRSTGEAKHIALEDNRITDIRNMLHSGKEGTHMFTGIYACSPEFLNYLKHDEKHSVITVFLELIKNGLLGGAVIDVGEWWDLGNRDAYLDAHNVLSKSEFPSYFNNLERSSDSEILKSFIGKNIKIDKSSHIAKSAIIDQDTEIINSIVWPGAKVSKGSILKRCIVRNGQIAKGKLENEDI
jgi:mannose-1-phosphate guanylyltransferase